MQLLDAILAFTLTMAALATVVTVIMEAVLRVARMRKKNMVEVMRLLNKELGKGLWGMSNEERWDFFVKVVENPVETTIENLKPLWKDLDLEARLAFFGRGKSTEPKLLRRFFEFIVQLLRDKKRAGFHENVSLEYLLRCLAETTSVQQASITASKTLKAEFNRIARKYEEIGSSVSANFKRHAQVWSIWIGIGLAIAANIDGIRIFEAYRVDPSLATAVIAQQETFTQNFQDTQETTKKVNEAAVRVDAARAALNQAQAAKNEAEITLKKAALAKAEAALEEQVSLKNIQQTALRAQQQLADLVALGIPLGWKLYPNCPYGGTVEQWGASSPKCKEIPAAKRGIQPLWGWKGFRILSTACSDPGGFFLWLFEVVVTGILIGLGAPFWYDIAKRLAQVRKGLQKATASTEYRLSARDANGDYKKRREIVDNVLADAAGEEDARLSQKPRGRPLLTPDGNVYTKG